ncbi:MAG: RNA-guided endonuclease TnpB family protein [Parachlamydia sp.]|nr:RNA-guided endonuclease TnpB family protein [Parachlamydia sp.]
MFKTYFPSSTFSPVGFTVSENTVTRSRKIRIYPNNKPLFNKYLGLTRYWYNKAVEHLRKEGTKAYLPEVRKALFVPDNHPVWAFDCPQRVREHAISDAVSAVKNAKKKFKTSGFQQVSFRSRKDNTQRFGFDKQALKDSFVFGSKKHRGGFYASEGFVTEMEGTEIIKESGRFYLIIPRKVSIKIPESQRFDCVSLDPGVRTFQTMFSPELQGKIGDGDFKRIFKLCLNMDKLIAKSSKSKCKAKRNIKKALERLRWKIKDLIEELHKKLAHFLVKTFDKILIPTFETSQMVTKLRSKTARSMLTFAHYRFKEFLKCKAEEYSCEVIEVNEAYTSKTCSYCGKIHDIGSKKIMKCSCGITEDRDINGARGIYLRALTVTSG